MMKLKPFPFSSSFHFADSYRYLVDDPWDDWRCWKWSFLTDYVITVWWLAGMVTGERQAARIRGTYLKTILKQDFAFFDNGHKTLERLLVRMSGDTVLIQDAMGEKAMLWQSGLVERLIVEKRYNGGDVINVIVAVLNGSIFLHRNKQPPDVPISRLAYLKKPEGLSVLIAGSIAAILTGVIFRFSVYYFPASVGSTSLSTQGEIGCWLSADAATVRALVGDSLSLLVKNIASAVAGLVHLPFLHLGNWH
ncbi:hypothetical protein NC651_031059 [Populus alba x Populus x berolinensis]|nr:hypothetical protein NC651_031059 [Populus alba x Populus x berolinensis]